MTNASPIVAPPGGKTRVIGTNPIAFSVPDGSGGDRPLRGAELDDVKKIAGDVVDVGSLEAHKTTGVPSGQELTRRFSSVAYKIINAQEAPKDDSRINRLLAAAKSIVQVRRTDIPAEEKTTEAAVARIEQRLKSGDMGGALALAEKLPEAAKTPAREWMSQLAARAGVDRAIAKIEEQLKASLRALLYK